MIIDLASLRRLFRLHVLWLLLALMLPGVRWAHASSFSVMLLLSDEGEPYRQFEEAFRSNLAGSRDNQFSISRATVRSLSAEGGYRNADLVVAVGVRAFEFAAKSETASSVLGVLVPRQAFMQLRRNASTADGKVSAIYLDQPWSRRFMLIREALPGTKKVGVLIGPESIGEIRNLQSAARDAGMTLITERVQQAEQILPALRHILEDSEAILALPDGVVFNRNTIQSILLTSYRAQNPLIAYSPSYVAAGALTAVYSTPTQVAQQAAEQTVRFFKPGQGSLSAAQYAKYFSVSVNQQLARSMGITIAPENVLHERLMASEARE